MSPTKLKDSWEPRSGVPISPYPNTEQSFGHVDWSQNDAEEMDEHVEKTVVAEEPSEVELDQVVFQTR